MTLAIILLLPALGTAWALWSKFTAPLPPEPFALSLTGAGALIINLSCAFILARFRAHSGSLTRAALLSARNDAVANVAIIVAGLITAYSLSVWPDVIVGIGIAVMNMDAARGDSQAAKEEHRAALWGLARRLLRATRYNRHLGFRQALTSSARANVPKCWTSGRSVAIIISCSAVMSPVRSPDDMIMERPIFEP